MGRYLAKTASVKLAYDAVTTILFPGIGEQPSAPPANNGPPHQLIRCTTLTHGVLTSLAKSLEPAKDLGSSLFQLETEPSRPSETRLQLGSCCPASSKITVAACTVVSIVASSN